jgi:hypothetical protein
MFYSTLHWRRLVNGYSGGAPPAYEVLTESLKDVATRPDRAWQAIADSPATHAIVHEASYAGGGPRVSAWLRSRGAREIAAFGPTACSYFVSVSPSVLWSYTEVLTDACQMRHRRPRTDPTTDYRLDYRLPTPY